MDGMKQFDSLEEMMAYMKEAEETAISRAHPQQVSIGYGEYVVRPTESFLVFGRIYEKDERDKGEEPHTIKRLDEVYDRGYRTGMWYSEAVPIGEYGDAHVVVLWRIFQEEFEAAQELEWETDAIMALPWAREMFARISAEESEGGATGTGAIFPNSIAPQEDQS